MTEYSDLETIKQAQLGHFDWNFQNNTSMWFPRDGGLVETYVISDKPNEK